MCISSNQVKLIIGHAFTYIYHTLAYIHNTDDNAQHHKWRRALSSLD